MRPGCLSELELDRLVAGEGAPERARWEAHAAGCPACAARLAERRAEAEAFPGQVDIPRLASEALARATAGEPGRPARSWLRLLWLAPAAAAACAALLWLLGPFDAETRTPDDGYRRKGQASMKVVVKRGERTFMGEDGGRYRAGDQLRFLLTAEEPLHFALFDLEASGKQTRFVPAEGRPAAPVRLTPGPRQALPESVELDASPGREHLVGLFCPEAFDLEALVAAIQAWDRTPAGLEPAFGPFLERGCTPVSFALNKEAGDP